MLDRYWHGDSQRISPEAPVPVVRVEELEERAGAAANVALNIAGLNAKVRLVGVTGKDEAAKTLLAILKAGGVQCDGVMQLADYSTVIKLRVLSRNQQLLRLDFENTADKVPTDFPAEKIASYMADSDVVVISDYKKGGIPKIAELIALARRAKVPVLIDPKGTNFDIYKGATLLTPNFQEFQDAVAQPIDSEEALVQHGSALIKRLALEALLITRGAAGMTLLQRGQDPLHLPAEVLEVYDVTGAGDTVIATMGAALGARLSMVEATRMANMAAGIAVGRMGTAMVSVAEMERCARNRGGSARGIMSRTQLVAAVERARKAGKRIVLSNGCFDILHLGHVYTLEQAAGLGDYLVVGVNSDASVRRLKGEGRPVNALRDRMGVLAALKSVDWVVSFDEDTPHQLLRAVKPEVLVKGGDYRKDEVVCADLVEGYGGEVRVFDKIKGVSTTDIIGKAR